MYPRLLDPPAKQSFFLLGTRGVGKTAWAHETFREAHLRAVNDYQQLGYRLHYWRTATGDEVDFVLYGERGLRAFEVRAPQNVRADDLRALLRFRDDYPQAKTCMLRLGSRRWHDRGVEVLPFLECVTHLDEWM